MEALLAEFRENLRMALSDPGTTGVYAYQDEQLDGALRTIVQLGKGPAGVAIKEGDSTSLDPAPSTPDARGYLVFQAALLIIGGMIPSSFKTRAVSVMISPFERQATIDHLRRQVQQLETTGDPHGTGGSACFGIWQDFENALCRRTNPHRIA